MEGFVYILQSEKNDSYYIGSSIDVAYRLQEHNDGKASATVYLRPWKLVFTKRYPTIRKARQIEYKLKKLKRRDIIERIVQDQDITMQ